MILDTGVHSRCMKSNDDECLRLLTFLADVDGVDEAGDACATRAAIEMTPGATGEETEGPVGVMLRPG